VLSQQQLVSVPLMMSVSIPRALSSASMLHVPGISAEKRVLSMTRS